MALLDYRLDCAGCTRCSVCKWVPFYELKRVETRHICPAITKYGFHAYSGGGKLNVALSVMEEHAPMGPAVADIAYKCNLCGACDYVAKTIRTDYEIAEVIEELRFACVDAGQMLSAHEALVANMRNEGNCMGQPASDRIDWAAGVAVKKLSEGGKGDVFYHAGCDSAFDPVAAERTRVVLKLLVKAEVDVVIAGAEEQCSGSEALQLGYVEEGTQAGRALLDQVHQAGAKVIVTPSAHCFAAFRYYYPRHGVDLGSIRVFHLTELLDQLVAEGRIALTESVPLAVTYHDPCNLGRRSEPFTSPWTGRKKDRPLSHVRTGEKGVYEPPRRLLEAIPGVKLVEMDRIRGYAWCCGGGAGVPEANPELSVFAASERIDEAGFTGASVLVSACPRCEAILTQAAEAADSNIEVLDVVDLVLRSVGDA